MPANTRDLDEHVSVFSENSRRRRAGIRCHIAAPYAEVGLYRGVPISMPTRLFLELAESLSLVDLVIAGDAMVRKKRTTPEALLAACRNLPPRGPGPMGMAAGAWCRWPATSLLARVAAPIFPVRHPVRRSS